MRFLKTMGILFTLAAIVAALSILLGGAASAQAAVNCDEFPGSGDKTDPYVVSGTVEGDLLVTRGVCHLTGTVMGDVIIKDAVCAGYPDTLTANGDRPFTAFSVGGGLRGGTVQGSTIASGGSCVMEWLGEGATIGGNVVFDALGNMGFMNVVEGEPGVIGATVNGSILIKAGRLFAGGSAATNYVDGNIVCDGGEPTNGLGSGSAIDWDGSGDGDGTIGGQYLCGQAAQSQVQADRIKIFDMNARNASEAFAATGTGVTVVDGTSVDFKIIAQNLTPIEVYEVMVTIRTKGEPFSTEVGTFAKISFQAISDDTGALSLEKNDFDIAFLPPGEYRLDFAVTHPDFTEPGRTDLGKSFTGVTGRDPILTCQPATFVTVPE